jgi:hypothetical protein
MPAVLIYGALRVLHGGLLHGGAPMSKHTPGPLVRLWTVKKCEIGGFHAIGRKDEAPTAYVANLADAELYAAAPDLYAAVTTGAELALPEFLEWLADCMVYVYGESAHVDYVITCWHRADMLRKAIAKAEGR